jgi:hypothetical protein
MNDVLLEASLISFLAQVKPGSDEEQEKPPTMDDVDYADIGDPREKL